MICTEDAELYLLLKYILNGAGFSCVLAIDDTEAAAHIADGALLAMIVDGAAWQGDLVSICLAAKQADHLICALIAGGMQSLHLQMIKAGLNEGIVRPLDPRHLIDFLRGAQQRDGVSRRSVRDPFGSANPETNDGHLRLTQAEARIIEVLSSRRDEPISRKQLVASAWPGLRAVNARTVDAYIARLRKRLPLDSPLRIETVYGQGYMLVSRREADAKA